MDDFCIIFRVNFFPFSSCPFLCPLEQNIFDFVFITILRPCPLVFVFILLTNISRLCPHCCQRHCPLEHNSLVFVLILLNHMFLALSLSLSLSPCLCHYPLEQSNLVIIPIFILSKTALSCLCINPLEQNILVNVSAIVNVLLNKIFWLLSASLSLSS